MLRLLVLLCASVSMASRIVIKDEWNEVLPCSLSPEGGFIEKEWYEGVQVLYGDEHFIKPDPTFFSWNIPLLLLIQIEQEINQVPDSIEVCLDGGELNCYVASVLLEDKVILLDSQSVIRTLLNLTLDDNGAEDKSSFDLKDYFQNSIWLYLCHISASQFHSITMKKMLPVIENYLYFESSLDDSFVCFLSVLRRPGFLQEMQLIFDEQYERAKTARKAYGKYDRLSIAFTNIWRSIDESFRAHHNY